MNQGRIYGICLVKDEADIIAQLLTFALRHCERIFVIDTGSTDETWTIVQDVARQHSSIVPFEQTLQPYGDWLRARVFNAVHRELSANDWWLILDADEFLAEDPTSAIKTAVSQGADLINAWQIQFYFTDRDLEEWEQGKERRDVPIVDRRRYYLINWQEPRFFRNQPRRDWDVKVSIKLPDGITRLCTRRILNRHYQYRDPKQMEKRLSLRYGHVLFPHVLSSDWHTAIRDSRKLNFHGDGDPWHFSSSGLFDFYRRHLGNRIRSAYQGGAKRRLKRLVTFK